MSREAALTAARGYVDTGRFARDLAGWVAMRSESQRASSAPDLTRYLETAIRPRLEQSGFACVLHPNPLTGQDAPFLIATRIEDPALPCILSYGHGDTVLGQDEGWSAARAPFTLSVEGDKLFGRGTADNKGQHLVNIAALETVLAARGRLGFNVKIVFEMGEEIGSPGLAEMMAQLSRCP